MSPSSFSCAFLIGLAWLAQVAPPASAPGEISTDPLLQRVPETEEDIRERTALAERRLAELDRTVENETDVSDEAFKALQAARQELAQVWRTYLESLQRLTAVRQDLATVTDPEHLEALAEELAALKEEASRLKRSAVPAVPTEADVSEAQAHASNVKAQVDTLAEAQAQRSALVAEDPQRQGQLLQEELRQIRGRRGDIAKELVELGASGSTTAQQQRLHMDKERLDVRQAVVQLAIRLTKPTAEHTRHAFYQGEQRLSALQALLAASQDRVNALKEARARARVRDLETAETSSPTETALRDLKLFRERVLLGYFQDPEHLRQLQERFPLRAAERLQTRMELANAYWSRVRETLQYQGADELLSLFEQSREAIADDGEQLEVLRAKLGRTLEDLQLLQSVRERALKRFNVLAEKVTSTIKPTDTAQRTQFQSVITTERAEFIDDTTTAVGSVEEVSARIETAIARLEAHLDQVGAVQEALRWARLTTRDSEIWGTDWARAWGEVKALWQPAQAGPVTELDDQPAAMLHRELFGEQRDAHTEWRRIGKRVADSVRNVSGRAWAWIIVCLILAGAAGTVLHRASRRRGVRLAQAIVVQVEARRDEAHPVRSGLSTRVDLLLLNMVGDLAIPVLVAGTLSISAWQVLTAEATQLVLAVLIPAILGFAMLRLVHHLFEAESPPHRPIPCSDRVARHYRKWLGLMIVFSVVVLILPITLRTAGVGEALRVVLFELHKTGLLLLLVSFLFRKECVLGLGDLGKFNWGLMLTWIVYPLLVVAALALFILEVIGYSVFVAYVGTGLLLSFGILIVLGTVIEYLSDVIENRVWWLQHPDAGSVAISTGGAPAAGLEAGRSLYVVTLLRWVIRVAGLALMMLLILRAWGVPVQVATLDWGRIGLGVLAVLVALLLDRLILTLLLTLGATGRMPSSTVSLIRRWVRGVLTVVAALTIIAVAGFDVKSLWTLLATFLAMVAIGFVAVWSILSNVLATLVILIWRPFNVGERISVLPEDIEGEVVDINFIYTILKSDDGTKMAIPNNLFAQKFIRRQAMRGMPKRTLAEQLESEKPLGE